MEYLAYSLMVQANQEANPDTEYNMRQFQLKFNWKKLLKSAWLALAGVGLLFASITQAQAASSRFYVRTNGSCLNVRQNPSANSRIVACIPNGSALGSIVDTENGYSYVRGYGGYVATKWVSSRAGTGTTPGGGVGGPVVLSVGSSGPAVTRIQNILGVPPTGYYGSLTARAVREFQANNGLLADGKIGPETRSALGIF